MTHKKTRIILGLIIGLISFCSIQNNASAQSIGGATTIDGIMPRVYLSDLYNCYNNGNIKDIVEINGYSGITKAESIIAKKQLLPTGNGDKASCDDILRAAFPGYFESGSVNAIREMLPKLGYTEEKDAHASKRLCKKYAFSVAKTDKNGMLSASRIETPEICALVDADGKVVGNLEYPQTMDSSNPSSNYMTRDPDYSTQCSVLFKSMTESGLPQINFNVCSNKDWQTAVNKSVPGDVGSSWELLSGGSMTYLGTVSSETGGAGSGRFTITDMGAAYKIAAKNMYGIKNITEANLKFTNSQVAALAQYYVDKYATTRCTSDSNLIAALTASGTDVGGYTKVHLVNVNGDGKVHDDCYTKLKDGSPSSFNMPGSDNLWHNASAVSFSDVINRLNSLANTSSNIIPVSATVENEKGDIIMPDGSVYEEAVQESSIDNQKCHAAAGALGWVLCPILDLLSSITSSLYEKMIEPMLNINTGALFNGSGREGIRVGWEQFQIYANIAFGAILLFIVFSQLTGVGIDNYGIKRMLPRIIVGAILVNLSMLICQVAIDASNILGNSLKDLLVSWGDKVELPSVGGGGPATLISVMVTSAVGALGAAWVYSNPLVLLALIPALITAVCSIFFLFLILGVRQAAVIILIVLSPLAMVCYMLPNTKNLFKKWVDILKAVLLVYPICGLLIGGGYFASRIMLSVSTSAEADGGGFFNTLAAMLLDVVPFFLIPSLLRSSMNGIGNLGGRIANFGQRFGGKVAGGTDRAVRSSDWVKNQQENNVERKARRTIARLRRSAGVTSEDDEATVRSKLSSNLSKRQRKQYMAHNNILRSNEAQSDANKFRRTLASIDAKNLQEDTDNMVSDIATGSFQRKDGKGALNYNDLEEVGAELQARMDAGDTNEALALMQFLESKNDKGIEQVAKAYRGAKMNGQLQKQIDERITSNGAYKKSDPNLHNAANNSLKGTSGSYARILSSGAALGSMKAANFNDMTDTAKQSVFNIANGSERQDLEQGIIEMESARLAKEFRSENDNATDQEVDNYVNSEIAKLNISSMADERVEQARAFLRDARNNGNVNNGMSNADKNAIDRILASENSSTNNDKIIPFPGNPNA